MAIEVMFLRLTTAFEAMCDALRSLGLTVIEDRPAHDEVLLVERLGNIVEDLCGWAAEGHASAVQAQKAVAYPLDGHRAREALGNANERFIKLKYRFVDEAMSHRMIDGLLQFGRQRGLEQRGREWLGWSDSVIQALETCRPPVRELDEALVRAWLELSERLGSRSVSLQTTNIGQQISASLPDAFGGVVGCTDKEKAS